MNQLLYRGEPVVVVGKIIQYTFKDGERIIADVINIIGEVVVLAKLKVLFSTTTEIYIGREMDLYVSNTNIDRIKLIDFEIGL